MKTAIKAGIALMLALGLMTLFSPLNLADGSALGVTSCTVAGNTVLVTVSNSDGIGHSGTLMVLVRMGSITASKTQAVQVRAAGSESVVLSFPMPVTEVVSAGVIVDGSNPF